MDAGRENRSALIRTVTTRLTSALVVLSAMFFLPAWTFAYREAWVYLGIILLPMSFVVTWLLKHDPALLARRMNLREQQPEQRLIVKLAVIPFLLAFILPGFDVRLGWSHVPVIVELAADAVVLLSYGFIFLVFRENSYASRVIEVSQGQTVISTGPYSLVRHPMYVGSLVLDVFSPLALGSYWAMLPAVLIVPVFVARIRNEEAVLLKELPGYREYRKKVRYRMFPGIW